MQLVRALAETLQRDMPGVEARPAKSAHATLARFRRSAGAAEARRVGEALEGESRRDTLERVAMVSSTLTPSGAVYTVVSERTLGGG